MGVCASAPVKVPHDLTVMGMDDLLKLARDLAKAHPRAGIDTDDNTDAANQRLDFQNLQTDAAVRAVQKEVQQRLYERRRRLFLERQGRADPLKAEVDAWFESLN